MTSYAVSILHAPGDTAIGRKIAGGLSACGHRTRLVEAGQSYTGVINASDAAIVIWTAESVDLEPLIEIARTAHERGIIAPISMGRVHAPKEFAHLQPMDLTGWTGELEDPRWRFMLDEVDFVATRPTTSAQLSPNLANTTPTESEYQREASTDHLSDLEASSALSGEQRVLQKETSANPSTSSSRRLQPSHYAVACALGLAAVVTISILFTPEEFWSGEDRAQELVDAIDVESASEPALISVLQDANQTDVQLQSTPDTDYELTVLRDGTVSGFRTSRETQQSNESTIATDETESPDSLSASSENVDQADQLLAEPVFPVSDLPHEPAIKVGEPFSDCDVCPEIVAIPAGSFVMGSPVDEPARQVTEGPLTEVVFNQPFAMGVKEVSFEEWLECVDDGGCNGYAPYDHEWGRDTRPAIRISFDDAQRYVTWLSDKTGEVYRLPTEEEWEYAARAGARTPFSHGRLISVTRANFNGQYPYGAGEEEFRARTMPTGSFAANDFGLFDMHGNVWEWTAGCWAETLGANEQEHACSKRVLRGGAWNTGGWRLRAAHRVPKEPSAREFDNGFRVVRELN